MIVTAVGYKAVRKYSVRELSLMGIELRGRDDLLSWLRGYRPTDKGLWLPEPLALEHMPQ